ncbi:uncharacterized protein YbjT (DUF2867 family) [Variovorax sp. TBS-050B]|uniref:NmrA family NAD(P)-binding protein n=1 Tax=Variovorax sp. TBS-050B TaxID=2940551 RepID=UPI0024770AE5|nr:NmrA family NAD(P)-binding protein [Variovorax sp. TBS-050B]MDH6594393.1 uncharacterized protein YbjT (DUF2867 family) [Variovorax sp. TBS-050B]
MRHVVLGATGHVGSALVSALLARGEAVTAVTRDAGHAEALRRQGAAIAEADVFDVPALRRAIEGAQRLFLLNPPAPPDTDTSAEERRSLRCILGAIEGLPLEKIVAESTYGAQPGDRLGDLDVLYDMEQALAEQPVPVSVIRAAYYMSNWDAALAGAQGEGVVESLFPGDFELPMVAPEDLGRYAARLMFGAAESSGPHYVEGPERCTTADVAAAFEAALGRPVRLVEVPPAQWEDWFRRAGFSAAGAASYAAMTRATLDNPARPAAPERGSVSLKDYVAALVRRQAG